jgi:hypothetical protein
MMKPVLLWINEERTAKLVWNPNTNATVLSVTVGSMTIQSPINVNDLISLKAAATELVLAVRSNE